MARILFHRGEQFRNGVFNKAFHAEDLEKNTVTEVRTAGYKQALYFKWDSFPEVVINRF